MRYARELGPRRRLVLGRRSTRRKYALRVARDVDSADESGVAGTPTFFVNGRRHYGAYDLETLRAVIEREAAVKRRSH